MTTFSAHKEARKSAPARVFELPRSAFADDCADKPNGPIPLGVRLLTDADQEAARVEATKFAWWMHDGAGDPANRVDCFNDALLRGVVARVITSPDDVEALYFEDAEHVGRALTSDGIRRLWDELQLLVIETSPLQREITDGELAALAKALRDRATLASLPPECARPLRRLLATAAEQLAVTTEGA